MNSVSLSGSKRQNVGRKDATNLRREGRIPCVIYGGEAQLHFHIAENDAIKMVRTPNVYIVEIDIEGTKAKGVIKEVQLHPVTDRISHIDFIQIFDNKPVKVNIPLRLTGHSIGVRNGGKLRQHFRKLTVEANEGDLPDTIDIDITSLKIGMKTRIGDIQLPGVKCLGPKSAVVVAIEMARGAKKPGSEDEEEE